MPANEEVALQLAFPSDRETLITRSFAAPRTLVFAAMTQPEHVRQWYGLRDHTMKVCEIDLRVGGKWRYVVQMPDGNEYAFSGEYLEIVPPERLVSTERFEAIPGSDYVATVTFSEQDGETTLTSHLQYQSPEHRDGHVNSGMAWGMQQTFARLDEHLASMAHAEREIVVMRVYAAPRELVWQTWTEPQHVVHWWGPDGFSLTIYEMDVRPGGRWHFHMHGPDGTAYLNQIVYVEVAKPDRLVYDHSPTPKFRSIVTFEEQGGKTTVSMRSIFETSADYERAVYVFHAIEGGKQTLRRLADYLTQLG